MNANDLLEWIAHLDKKERELPIVMSEHIFPEPDEIYFPCHIGHNMSRHYDGFIILVSKDFKKL